MSATAPPAVGWQTEWPTRSAGSPPRKNRVANSISSFPAAITMFLCVALLMKVLLIQLFFIPSPSMEPTLHGCEGCKGDRVIVNKLVYRFREPHRGEVVVFLAEEDKTPKTVAQRVRGFITEGLGVTTPNDVHYIKRVIGLPGETIEVRAKGVYITPPGGKRTKLIEPYAMIDGGANGNLQEPFVIPKDMYFMMGDNRNNSRDSRTSLGPIRRRDLDGKAIFRMPGVVAGQSRADRLKRLGSIEDGSYPARVGNAVRPLGAAAGVFGVAMMGYGWPLFRRGTVRVRRR